MSHPTLYDKRATNFFNLGRGVLKDAIRCIVTEERNGVFELEMTYPNEGVLANLLEVDHIIKADAGHARSSKDQRFRIERIDKSIDGLINVYAKHVSYLAQSLALQPDVQITNAAASEALAIWRQSIIGSHSFMTNSNLSERRSTHLTIQNCQNARQALGGASGSILDVWGGEYRFDNYRIDLLNERGGRANTLISYGRNLTDLDQEENISNTYTSVYPYAVFRNTNDEEEIITIPGFVIDAENAGAFAHRRVLPVDFSREFEQGVRPTIARLRTLAETFIEENEIGVPRVSIALSFVDLTKSLNQAGITYEQVNLCDTVPVYFEKLGIRTHAKVVRIEWNVLLDQYEKLEIGVMKKTLGDTIREIEREVNTANNNSNEALTSANGRNTVFFGPNEPTANTVGDLWYRPNGEHTELWMWNGSAWEFIMSTAPDDRILDKIEELERESEETWQESKRALAKAQKAFDVAEPLVQRTNELTEEAASVRLLAQGLQTTVTNNYTSTGSRITQLASDINLRVHQGELISQINLSPEAIRIQARRIHLAGESLIDHAVIRDAHIHSLNATKITAGTLNASSVNVINMNAANITTGFLNAARIQARSITSDHLAVNAIQVGFNNIGNIIRIHSTSLDVHNSGVLRSRINQTGLHVFGRNGAQVGEYSWGHNTDGSTHPEGISMNVYRNAFGAITSRLGNTSGTHFFRVLVDGTTGVTDLWGARLRNNINANGHGFTGNTRFSGAGDVRIDQTKALRIGILGTENFTTNRQAHLSSWVISGVNGLVIGDRRSDARGGFFIGNNGAIGLRHRSGGARLLDVENRSARSGRFRIGQFCITWGSGTSTGVTGGGTRNTNWTFGATYANTPVIMVTSRTGVPERVSVGTTATSTSGFTLHVHRTNATSTDYDWVAIGPVTS